MFAYLAYHTDLAVLENGNAVIWVAGLQQRIVPTDTGSTRIGANETRTGTLITLTSSMSYVISNFASDDFLEAKIVNPIVSEKYLQYTVSIYESDGRLLHSQKSTSGEDYIRCKVTAAGNYYVVVSGDAANYSPTTPYTLTVK